MNIVCCELVKLTSNVSSHATSVNENGRHTSVPHLQDIGKIRQEKKEVKKKFEERINCKKLGKHQKINSIKSITYINRLLFW